MQIIYEEEKKRENNTYVSPVGVFDFSLVSTFLLDMPPGTGSSVSRRRTPGPGKRTVCERTLSAVLARPVTELDVIIDDTGGPPLALVFNNKC